MTKIASVWIGAAILTYNACQENVDWKLEDIIFRQQDIVKSAQEVLVE